MYTVSINIFSGYGPENSIMVQCITCSCFTSKAHHCLEEITVELMFQLSWRHTRPPNPRTSVFGPLPMASIMQSKPGRITLSCLLFKACTVIRPVSLSFVISWIWKESCSYHQHMYLITTRPEERANYQ